MQTLLLTLIDAGAAALSYRVGVEEPAQVQAGAVILIRRADAADDLATAPASSSIAGQIRRFQLVEHQQDAKNCSGAELCPRHNAAGCSTTSSINGAVS